MPSNNQPFSGKYKSKLNTLDMYLAMFKAKIKYILKDKFIFVDVIFYFLKMFNYISNYIQNLLISYNQAIHNKF